MTVRFVNIKVSFYCYWVKEAVGDHPHCLAYGWHFALTNFKCEKPSKRVRHKLIASGPLNNPHGGSGDVLVHPCRRWKGFLSVLFQHLHLIDSTFKSYQSWHHLRSSYPTVPCLSLSMLLRVRRRWWLNGPFQLRQDFPQFCQQLSHLLSLVSVCLLWEQRWSLFTPLQME